MADPYNRLDVVVMKGQMVIEFLVAVAILMVVVFYVLNYLNTGVSIYSSESRVSSLQSRSVLISELLLKTGGAWTGSVPIQPGIELDWPVLNYTKISYLELFCNAEYSRLLDMLDIPGRRVRITIVEGGVDIMECGPGVPEGSTNVHTRRYGLSEGNDILEMNVWLW